MIDRDELYQQLSRMIKQQKSIELYQAREEAKRFLEFICDRTGLLNEQGQECYAFVHKTFQEYLTAQEINYQRDNEDFEIVLTHIETHLHNPHWREVLLLTIAQQAPKKAALAIRKILNANSPYEQWLHRDLLFAARCLAENVKELKAKDPKLSSEILPRLLELEVSDVNKIGEQIGDQVLEILCSFNETEFETAVLQLIKTKAAVIDEDRLRKYRSALGEETEVITELFCQFENEDSSERLIAVRAFGELGIASGAVVQALLQQLDNDNAEVRWNSVRALGNLRNSSEPVVQVLLRGLDSKGAIVQLQAARALERLGVASEPVVQVLLQRLNDEASYVRSSAASALGNLGKTNDSIQPLIIQWIEQHQDSEDVGGAIDALWQIVEG